MQFQLAKYLHSEDKQPIFLAEIGTFFNQDTALAKKLIAGVARARDANPGITVLLKGEVLHNADICRADSGVNTSWRDSDGNIVTESYRAIIERKTVSLDAYADIFAYAHDLALPLVLSVYDGVGVDFAREQGAIAIKIATSNLRHAWLQRRAAKSGLFVMLDDGGAPLSTVALAVERLLRNGVPASHILVEHSPDGHPAPPEHHHLRIIESYRAALGLPVGLSDHYDGEDMLLAATCLGYAVLEKGVAPAGASDQDVSHAMCIDDLGSLLERIDSVHRALGNPRRPMELSTLPHKAYMGLITARDIAAGQTLSDSTVSFAFPVAEDGGIGAEHWEFVEGWHFRNSLPCGSVVRWRDVQSS